MELDNLKQRLVSAARRQRPDGRVPHGFERRIMAHLVDSAAPDAWILWSRALWRAAIPCLLILVFSSLWSVRSRRSGPTDLSQQIENVVLSDFNQNLASAW